FLNKKIPTYAWDRLPKGVERGADYLRYSSDHSNPASLDQQMLKQLERARHDSVFIPWEFVFADAAVSGTTAAARHGYTLLKRVLNHGGDTFNYLYIDEIGRAARDTVEALTLGRIIDEKRKRMISIDGFDSSSQDARLRLGLFASLEEYYIQQLRG